MKGTLTSSNPVVALTCSWWKKRSQKDERRKFGFEVAKAKPQLRSPQPYLRRLNFIV